MQDLEQQSPLNKAWTCFKHGTTSYRKAMLLELAYQAANDLRVESSDANNSSTSNWRCITEIPRNDENVYYYRKELYTVEYAGLNITIERVFPKYIPHAQPCSHDELTTNIMPLMVSGNSMKICSKDGTCLLDEGLEFRTKILDILSNKNSHNQVYGALDTPTGREVFL